MKNKVFENIKSRWLAFYRGMGDSEHARRIKMLVFFICIVLAFCLWMVVNLNRNYDVAIKLPVEVGNIASQKALANKLPHDVTASVSGRGWDLINTYNNPPHVFVDVSGKEINLFKQVRQQLRSVSNVTVKTVNPLYLQVKLEEKKSKKVPVKVNVNTTFAGQYDSLGAPVISPDSVTIRGAASHVDNIQAWPTDSVKFSKLDHSMTKIISLKQPSVLINVSERKVNYQLRVGQFTEEQATLPVETKGFNPKNVVTFSPSSIQITYRIPLHEYANKKNKPAFKAYVTYDQIKKDTTGFVEPTIKKLAQSMHLKLKNVNPRQVAYFTILKYN